VSDSILAVGELPATADGAGAAAGPSLAPDATTMATFGPPNVDRIGCTSF